MNKQEIEIKKLELEIERLKLRIEELKLPPEPNQWYPSPMPDPKPWPHIEPKGGFPTVIMYGISSYPPTTYEGKLTIYPDPKKDQE
jgi:hypothetical protein